MPPLQPGPAEQLVDDLIGPRLNPRVALQHRFWPDAEQLGWAVQRDGDVLADPPLTALGVAAHATHRSAENVTTDSYPWAANCSCRPWRTVSPSAIA